MSKQKQIQEVLDLTAQDLLKLGERERKTVYLVLKQAEVELSDALSLWLAKVTDGSERFTAQRYRELLRQVKEASTGIETLQDTVRRALAQTRYDAGVLAVNHLKTQYGALAETLGKPTPLNLDVAAALAQNDQLLIRRHATSAIRYAEETKSWIGKQLAVGVLRRETFDELGTRLMKLKPVAGRDLVLPPPTSPEAGAQMAKGLYTFPRHRADRLVRTESIYAYNSHHQAAIVEAGLQKRWDAALDRRGCSVCASLHGTIVAANKEFPGGFDHPPAHPFCRCTVVGWDAAWEE